MSCTSRDVLFVLSIIGICFLPHSQSEQFEGEYCTLPNGKIGVCTNINNCPTAIADLDRNIFPVQCGFVGNIAIVCCEQQTTPPPTPKPSKVDTSRPGNVAAHQCKIYGREVFDVRLDVGFSFVSSMRNDSTCKLETGDGFIIGGKNTELEEFPHSAVIGFGQLPNIEWRCTGSLIAEQWILTAAHCNAEKSLGNAAYVRVGFVDLNSNLGETLAIIKRIKYPTYTRSSYYNDISLFMLERPVKFKPSLRPACLRYKPNIQETSVLAAGWGFTDWRIQETAKVLQKVSLNVYDKQTCDNIFFSDSKLANGVDSKTQLCIGALEGGRDTCNGDSGGSITILNPDVYCMQDIVGITSVGSQFCGTLNSAGLYTRVYNYLDWIERIVWPHYFTNLEDESESRA